MMTLDCKYSFISVIICIQGFVMIFYMIKSNVMGHIRRIQQV